MTEQVYDPNGAEMKRLMKGALSGARKGKLGKEPVFTTRPELMGTFGMVASTHWLATAAGYATLEKGGNAFDAACATGFALQVLEPYMNGPAGDAPVVLYDVKTDKVHVICGQGSAPAAMTIEKFRELGITEVIPGTGLLPAPVPGAFGAWMMLLRDFGTMKLRDVLEPMLGYARNGFPVNMTLHNCLSALESLYREEWTSSADVYLKNGVPNPGDLLGNTALADTYERILKESEAGGGSREKQID
ncbi:MAG: gamma-glutamyltransferase, partial [Rhodospirillales bacterium]